MALVTLHFEGVVQTVDVRGTDDDHISVRVLFAIEAQGRRWDGLSVEVRQSHGESLEAPLVIGAPPPTYDGPYNWGTFRRLVERYYREAVGPEGGAIRIGPNSQNIIMLNNLIGYARSLTAQM